MFGRDRSGGGCVGESLRWRERETDSSEERGGGRLREREREIGRKERVRRQIDKES